MRQYKKYLPHLLVGGTAAGLAWWWWKNSQATVCPAAPALRQPQQRVEYAPSSEPRGMAVELLTPVELPQSRGKDVEFLPPVGMPQSDLTPLQIAQAMLTAAEQQAADPTLDADAHAAAIAMQPALRAKVAALSNPAAQI